MQKDSSDIGKLFSEKFENFEAETSFEDWDRLNSRLSRINFVKFSFQSFNIYYLSIIMALAGTSVFAAVSYYNSSQKLKQLEMGKMVKENIRSNTIVVPADISKDEKENPAEIKQVEKGNIPMPDKTFIDSSKTDSHVKYDNNIQILSLIKQDSVETSTSTPKKTDTVSSGIKRVKKVIMIKPTHVIVKDTIIVKK